MDEDLPDEPEKARHVFGQSLPPRRPRPPRCSSLRQNRVCIVSDIFCNLSDMIETHTKREMIEMIEILTSAPSATRSATETSVAKSTCPGESTRFTRYFVLVFRTV